MKKITKAIVFLALILAAGSARAAAFNFSIALPAESLITEDLDARDAFNRPIPKSHVQLLELWSRNLNRMVLDSLTPLRLKMLAILNSRWDGFAGMLRTATQRFWEPVRSWLAEKKFQSNQRVSQNIHAMLRPPRPSFGRSIGGSFSALIVFVISSTRLLR